MIEPDFKQTVVGYVALPEDLTFRSIIFFFCSPLSHLRP